MKTNKLKVGDIVCYPDRTTISTRQYLVIRKVVKITPNGINCRLLSNRNSSHINFYNIKHISGYVKLSPLTIQIITKLRLV